MDEEKRQKAIFENREASKPVLKELQQAGFNVDMISDLYTKRFDYRRIIPLLLYWLPKVENPDVKEAIVRAISVPWAKGTIAERLLENEFSKQVSNPLLHWTIGNALSVVADDEVSDAVIELIQDKKNCKAREMLVVALGNMKPSKVEPFLIDLLNDENLAGYAIMALGKLKSTSALPNIQRFLTHNKTWIRNEAKKALKRIEK